MKSSNKELEELTVTFVQRKFRSEDGHYCVCLYRPRNGDYITVVGEDLPEVDYPVTFSGYWKTHPSFGKQFEVDMIVNQLPSNKREIVSFIQSVSSGIRRKQASAMVAMTGTADFWNILYNDKGRFLEIDGVTEAKLQRLVSEVKKLSIQKDLYQLFGNDLTMESWQYRKLCEVFAEDHTAMVDGIKDNPFTLIRAGFHFLDLDQFAAKRSSMTVNDYRRLLGASQDVLLEAQGQNHVGLPGLQFLSKLRSLLHQNGSVSDKDCRLFLIRAIAKKDLALYGDMVYLPKSFQEEAEIADKLSAMATLPPCRIDRKDFESYMQGYYEKKGFALSPDQENAVWTVLTRPVCVITGGPGTGKSTILDAILYCWKHFFRDGDWLLMAPTGKASVRMTETTQQPASTIHSTLQLGVDSGFDSPVSEDPAKVTCGLVIIDESSMIDQTVASGLIRALDKAYTGKQHFALVGDPDQLPSVGYGNILADLIHSDVIPVCSLSTIYRQAAGNPIISNSIRIREGITELDWSNPAFKRFHVGADAENMAAACKFYMRCVKAYGIENVAMLSPFHSKTDISTDALNKQIQDAYNPLRGRKSVKGIGVTFREGDRVMQLRNTEALSNGDIGTVTAIDPSATDAEPCLTVLFENGLTCEYPRDNLNQLDLAYAMSVHKSQGSQWPCVIFMLPNKPSAFLRKNILYTAITRSSKNVAIFGPTDTVRYAIKNDKQDTRYTQLVQRLQKNAKNRKNSRPA